MQRFFGRSYNSAAEDKTEEQEEQASDLAYPRYRALRDKTNEIYDRISELLDLNEAITKLTNLVEDAARITSEKLQEHFETLTGKMFALSEKVDKILEAVSKPPQIHPETVLLRESTEKRIAFLEKMVTDLTNKPVTTVEGKPQIQIVEKIVKEEVEKEFSVDDLTEDQLIEAAKELSDSQLLKIVRDRKKA